MKTIKAAIEAITKPYLEYFINMVDKNGEDWELYGIKGLDEPDRFVRGHLLASVIHLLKRYMEEGRSQDDIERMKGLVNRFAGYAVNMELKTWGRLQALRGLHLLHHMGMIEIIDAEILERLKRNTDYGDFVDKKTCKLGNLNNNYLHVAMAIAGYRELLGWENDGMSDKLKDALLDSMSRYSSTGWMDEDPGTGRFDRYSILISSEMIDTLENLGKPIPQFLFDNLQRGVELSLDMLNEQGNGISYGRSLSIHGDNAILEIFSTAAAHGLLKQKDLNAAIWYSLQIIKKTNDFWYDHDRKSINMWFDGRNSNFYRKVYRVLETNLDMLMHLTATLKNFEKGGLADYTPNYEYTQPQDWTVVRHDFDTVENHERALFVLKYKNHVMQLPIIGGGRYYKWPAYYPLPFENQVLEPLPEYHIPFLVPKLWLADGTTAMPLQYFKKVEHSVQDGAVTITAMLNTLARSDEVAPAPLDHSSAQLTYVFSGNHVTISYDLKTPIPIQKITMEYAGLGECKRDGDGARYQSLGLSVTGLELVHTENVCGEENFDAPHGNLSGRCLWAKEIGDTEVKLDININLN